MNAAAPVEKRALPPQPFAAATHLINAWRGRCTDAFARAEAAVTESLVALAAAPDRGASVRLPHLFGERIDALAAALAGHGEFADAVAALEGFRAQYALRTMLCHGVGKVTLDVGGRWTLALHVAALRSGKLTRDLLVLTQSEAEQRRDDLCRASRVLCSHLDRLRTRLASAPK